jgi:hypothetical protein
MAGRDSIQQVMADFGKTVGLDDLGLDEQDYCCLVIEQDLVINIEFDEAGERLMLYSKVGRPGPDREAELTKILQANYLGRGTGGATLGLQPESGAVVLSREVPTAGIDVPSFSASLENFVNVAEAWTRRLADAVSLAQPSAGSPDHPPVDRIRG